MKDVKLNDLIFVIIVGFIASIVVGVAVGTIEYLLYEALGFTLRIFFFIGVFFLAGYIRMQYTKSTVLYQVLAVIFTIHGYFLSMLISNVFGSGFDQIQYLFKMVYSIEWVFYYFDPSVIFSGNAYDTIEYLFLFISCAIAYVKTK